MLFGKAVVAIAQPLDQSNEIRSAAGFWTWMFFLLTMVMMAVFSIQGSVFALCSERLMRRACKLALAQMLRQEMAFFDEKETLLLHSPVSCPPTPQISQESVAAL